MEEYTELLITTNKEQVIVRPRKFWIMGDTHWNHPMAWGRPHNHTEKTIKNLKYYVMPQDYLIHLGDVIWGGGLAEILKEIPGRKILVRGNHDKETGDWYAARGFGIVVDYMSVRGVLFSHKPMILLDDTIRYNIHGHFHNNPPERWEPELVRLLTVKHLLFAPEYTAYKPLSLDHILAKSDVFNTLKIVVENKPQCGAFCLPKGS